MLKTNKWKPYVGAAIQSISLKQKKNFAKILIYLSVYVSLNSRIVASKISNKPLGVN